MVHSKKVHMPTDIYPEFVLSANMNVINYFVAVLGITAVEPSLQNVSIPGPFETSFRKFFINIDAKI